MNWNWFWVYYIISGVILLVSDLLSIVRYVKEVLEGLPNNELESLKDNGAELKRKWSIDTVGVLKFILIGFIPILRYPISIFIIYAEDNMKSIIYNVIEEDY